MTESGLTTSNVASQLGVSRPTVRKLLRDGLLVGQAEARGSRFSWRISEASVAAYLQASGTSGSRQGKRPTVSQVREELDELREQVRALRAQLQIPYDGDSLPHEITSLREALVQQRAITDAISAADKARAQVVQHLLAALAAGEAADERRREALVAADALVGQFVTPRDAQGI